MEFRLEKGPNYTHLKAGKKTLFSCFTESLWDPKTLKENIRNYVGEGYRAKAWRFFVEANPAALAAYENPFREELPVEYSWATRMWTFRWTEGETKRTVRIESEVLKENADVLQENPNETLYKYLLGAGAPSETIERLLYEYHRLDSGAHKVDGHAIDPLCDYCEERHTGACEDDVEIIFEPLQRAYNVFVGGVIRLTIGWEMLGDRWSGANEDAWRSIEQEFRSEPHLAEEAKKQLRTILQETAPPERRRGCGGVYSYVGVLCGGCDDCLEAQFPDWKVNPYETVVKRFDNLTDFEYGAVEHGVVRRGGLAHRKVRSFFDYNEGTVEVSEEAVTIDGRKSFDPQEE